MVLVVAHLCKLISTSSPPRVTEEQKNIWWSRVQDPRELQYLVVDNPLNP